MIQNKASARQTDNQRVAAPCASLLFGLADLGPPSSQTYKTWEVITVIRRRWRQFPPAHSRWKFFCVSFLALAPAFPSLVSQACGASDQATLKNCSGQQYSFSMRRQFRLYGSGACIGAASPEADAGSAGCSALRSAVSADHYGRHSWQYGLPISMRGSCRGWATAVPR